MVKDPRIDVAHQSPKHEMEMREKWKWKWKSRFMAVAILEHNFLLCNKVCLLAL